MQEKNITEKLNVLKSVSGMLNDLTTKQMKVFETSIQKKDVIKIKQTLIDLIKIEISWSSEHPTIFNSQVFQDGFIAGLRQAIALIQNSE